VEVRVLSRAHIHVAHYLEMVRHIFSSRRRNDN
jgi:hypothetical protein